MAFLGLDPGDPNNWYQSPYLGLSPAGYGGGISGGYYRAPYHPYGSSTCAFTQFSSQPSPYPPLQLNPSATIINGHLFPHHFPGVAQQPLTTTPRDPYIPTYHSPHSNSNPGIYPSISQKYSYDPSGIGVHSQFIFTNAMTTPPIYPSAPSPPACEQPQYHRNTSIPTFQSPLDPTFVPQLQFSDPKPPSSFRPMSDCENHLRLDAILDSTPTGAAHYTPTQAPDGSSLPPSIDFDGNSDSENKESIAPNLKTNEEYACRYEDLKKRGLVDEHSGSDSSSEDDDVVVVLAANSKKKNLEFFEANIKVKVLDPILNNKEVGLSKSIDNEIEDTSLVKAENCKAMELGFKRHNELEEIYIEVHMDVDSDGARQILNSLIGLGNGHYPEFNSRYESHSPKSNETKTSKGSELALGGLWDDSGGLNTMQSKFKSFCKPGLVPGDFALIHDEDHILEDHEKSAIVTHSPQLCQKAGVKCKSCDGDLVGIVEDSQFYYFKKDKRSSAKEQVWAIYDDDERLRNYGLVDAVFNPGISISFVTLKLMAFNSCMSGNMSMDKERVQAFDDGTMGHGHQVENWLSLSLKPTSSLISPLEPYILMEVGGASTILMVVGETSTNYDQGVVPPNSTLYYEVELLSFVKDKEPWDMNALEKMEVAVSLLEHDIKTGPSDQSCLNFVNGIICKSKALMFERMLFHATRGNMFFNQAPADEHIMDPLSIEMVEWIVFLVFFSGLQAKEKIMKICEAFGVNCCPVPEDINKRRQITREASSHLAELEATLDAGIHHRNKVNILIMLYMRPPDDFKVDNHRCDFHRILIELQVAFYLRYINKQANLGRYDDSHATVSSTILNDENYMFVTVVNLCTALVFKYCPIGMVEVPKKWFLDATSMNSHIIEVMSFAFELLMHQHMRLRCISSRCVLIASVTESCSGNSEIPFGTHYLIKPNELFIIAVYLCCQLKTQLIDDVANKLITQPTFNEKLDIFQSSYLSGGIVVSFDMHDLDECAFNGNDGNLLPDDTFGIMVRNANLFHEYMNVLAKIIVAALCGKGIDSIELHVKMDGVGISFLFWLLAFRNMKFKREAATLQELVQVSSDQISICKLLVDIMLLSLGCLMKALALLLGEYFEMLQAAPIASLTVVKFVRSTITIVMIQLVINAMNSSFLLVKRIIATAAYSAPLAAFQTLDDTYPSIVKVGVYNAHGEVGSAFCFLATITTGMRACPILGGQNC